MTQTCEKHGPSILCNTPQFVFIWLFLQAQSRFCISDRNPTGGLRILHRTSEMHLTTVFPMTGDVTYSRHSTKVLSARALLSKCLFPWETRGLWGDALRLGKYSAPQQTFTQCWIEYFICGCKMKIFQLYPSFTFINWQFCIERNFLFPIYLFFSIGMDSCNLLSPSILQFTTVTHFDAQTVSVKLALVFLWHAPVWALPHFLAQDILGLSWAFPAPSPRSFWFLLVDNKILKPRVGCS